MSNILNAEQKGEKNIIEDAINLFSQQIWCWGKDIEKLEGNWLLEIGFERIEPPTERTNCPSIYSLEFQEGQHVILRGFGVFYGHKGHGGIFLPRYKFLPRFTEASTLKHLPWEGKDLAKLATPTGTQQINCTTLMIELIKWIQSYEENIVKQLGIEYRQATLAEWDNGIRTIVPAEDIAREWQLLGIAISKDGLY